MTDTINGVLFNCSIVRAYMCNFPEMCLFFTTFISNGLSQIAWGYFQCELETYLIVLWNNSGMHMDHENEATRPTFTSMHLHRMQGNLMQTTGSGVQGLNFSASTYYFWSCSIKHCFSLC